MIVDIKQYGMNQFITGVVTSCCKYMYIALYILFQIHSFIYSEINPEDLFEAQDTEGIHHGSSTGIC